MAEKQEIVFAVYATWEQAAAAIADLKAAGIEQSAIVEHVKAAGEEKLADGAEPSTGLKRDAAGADRNLDDRSSIVFVEVSPGQWASVLDLLEQHNPVELDEHASSLGSRASESRSQGLAARGSRSADRGSRSRA